MRGAITIRRLPAPNGSGALVIGPGGLARVGNNRHGHLARKCAEDASRERGAFASVLDKHSVEFKLHFLPPSISMIRAIAGRL